MSRVPQRFVLPSATCALVLALALAAWVLARGSLDAQSGVMLNCPGPGRWSIAIWQGPSGTALEDALAGCGPGSVDAAYSLDWGSQEWRRWFTGRPEASNMWTVGAVHGLLVRGSSLAPPTTTTTPLPTSTPVPVGTNYVSFSRTSDYRDSLGNLHVIGIVENESALPVRFTGIHAAFRDAAGKSLGSEYGPTCLHTVPAGGDSPFEIRVFDEPSSWDRYRLVADAYLADQPPPSGLEVSSQTSASDSAGMYHVFGLIANFSNDTYDAMAVCGALYGKDGKVMAAGEGFVRDHTIVSGGSTSYELTWAVDAARVKRYELWVDGQRQ